MTKLVSFAIVHIFFWLHVNAQAPAGPIKVDLNFDSKTESWHLLRNGMPYYIKGIGGQVNLDKAVAYGANSIRTWGAHEAINILDKAHEKGLTVLFGLWVGVERQGFDYNDTKAVQAQLARFTEIVKQYKNHPAILMWGIGNENDLFYSDFRVWNAIDDIAEMIKREDPNHPTMTVTAGLDVAEVQLIQERAPHIDVFGVNTYGGLIGIDKEMRAFGWNKPYIVAEWGPNGHWEVPTTKWKAPIEQTSTQKAVDYKKRYQLGILNDQQLCIGSYVFLWGHKQETTPTWYGLFLEDNTETEVMDVLQRSWSGVEPSNRAPNISKMTLNNKRPIDNLYVHPRQKLTFEITSSDPDNDLLNYVFELLPESTDIKSGGDKESRPQPVETDFSNTASAGKVIFKAPRKSGPYRIFVYIYDDKGKAATANFPFYVN